MAYRHGEPPETVQDAGKLFRFHAAENLVGEDHHGIAREDGAVHPPLSHYRRLAAPQVGVVHNVVMQQGEIMVDLHGQRYGEYGIERLPPPG